MFLTSRTCWQLRWVTRIMEVMSFITLDCLKSPANAGPLKVGLRLLVGLLCPCQCTMLLSSLSLSLLVLSVSGPCGLYRLNYIPHTSLGDRHCGGNVYLLSVIHPYSMNNKPQECPVLLCYIIEYTLHTWLLQSSLLRH